MSVLLEALKKAAEDKKRALEGTEQSSKAVDSMTTKENIEEGITPEFSLKDDALDSQDQTLLESLAEMKPSLSEHAVASPAENLEESEVKSSPSLSLASKEESEISLKLNLDSRQKEEELVPLPKEEQPQDISTASLNLVIESSTELNNAATSKDNQEPMESSALTEEQAALKSLSDEKPVEQPTAPVRENTDEKISSQTELKKNESLELHLENKESDQVSVTHPPNKNTLEHILDETHNSSEKEQIASKNDTSSTIKLEKETVAENRLSEPKKQLDAVSQALVNKSNDGLDQKTLKEDEDSYKWSLSALPGYLGLSKRKKQKNKNPSAEGANPILVAGALSEDPNRPVKKKSIKLILFLLVCLLFIGILFYGTFYYQEQYDALEQRMKKYNLVKTHIAKEEISDVNNKISEDKLETSEAISTEEVKEASLNKALNSAKPIEKTQKELVTNEKKSSSFKESNQINTSPQQQDDSTRFERASVTQQSVGSKVNQRVTKVPKDSRQVLGKNLTTSPPPPPSPSKAIIEVHSEENVLSEAYVSYEQGDFALAQQGFESVLAMNPKNEFANIGLGNILASKQQYVAAMEYYQRALAAEPSSLNAFEAIANISGHIALNSDWKNALSEMAKNHSESATLQYALGNLYAEEQDWLSAQSAYFQAVALEPDNADYLVNLAVSLDQLGKYHLAAQYYTEALAFVDVEKVNFNEADVKNRLILIRQFMAGMNP